MSTSGSSGDPESDGRDDLVTAADDARMRRRLSELQGRLDKVGGGAGSERGRAATDAGHSQGVGRALRVSSEFIGGVVVGSFLGYWIDRALGSWPIGFVVFFLLGLAAGFVNVMRAARQIQAEMPDIGPETAPPVEDDDDDGAAAPDGSSGPRS